MVGNVLQSRAWVAVVRVVGVAVGKGRVVGVAVGEERVAVRAFPFFTSLDIWASAETRF